MWLRATIDLHLPSNKDACHSSVSPILTVYVPGTRQKQQQGGTLLSESEKETARILYADDNNKSEHQT